MTVLLKDGILEIEPFVFEQILHKGVLTMTEFLTNPTLVIVSLILTIIGTVAGIVMHKVTDYNAWIIWGGVSTFIFSWTSSVFLGYFFNLATNGIDDAMLIMLILWVPLFFGIAVVALVWGIVKYKGIKIDL